MWLSGPGCPKVKQWALEQQALLDIAANNDVKLRANKAHCSIERGRPPLAQRLAQDVQQYHELEILSRTSNLLGDYELLQDWLVDFPQFPQTMRLPGPPQSDHSGVVTKLFLQHVVALQAPAKGSCPPVSIRHKGSRTIHCPISAQHVKHNLLHPWRFCLGQINLLRCK